MVQINLKAVTSVVDQSSSLTNVEKRVNFFKKLRKMCLHVVKITSTLVVNGLKINLYMGYTTSKAENRDYK